MADAPKDKSQPWFPLAGGADDGWSKDGQATATCFCGAVQLQFPTEEPGLVESFTCNCADCHKITASMFASNFVVLNTHLKHLRGQDLLSTFSQSKTVASGNTMTNSFCSKCGTLMYRVSSSWEGKSILRIGTVDDFHLHETILKPQVQQFAPVRPSWLESVKGVRETQGESH